MSKAKVLVAANGDSSHDAVCGELRRNGHEVVSVETGRDALDVCPEYDIMLLRLDIPDVDGAEFCRRVRERSGIPMIAFTDRDSEVERVLILQSGADDYLILPCGTCELMARIEAVLRRSQSASQEKESFSHGPLHLDCDAHEVYLNGRIIHFTRKEFGLLRLLVSQPQRVVSRQEISSEVWGYDAIQHSRTVDTHVNSIRKKLGENDWIRTIHGIGFRIKGKE